MNHPCSSAHQFLVNKPLQVRRTRISERMRKLQELVPNMDKVINNIEQRQREDGPIDSPTAASLILNLHLAANEHG